MAVEFAYELDLTAFVTECVYSGWGSPGVPILLSPGFAAQLTVIASISISVKLCLLPCLSAT